MNRRRVGRPTSWRPSPRRSGLRQDAPGLPNMENKTGSFDQWLDHRLREMYGAVVDEPLPRDLRDLVERLVGEDEDEPETPTPSGAAAEQDEGGPEGDENGNK
jgi:hypothetical protein